MAVNELDDDVAAADVTADASSMLVISAMNACSTAGDADSTTL